MNEHLAASYPLFADMGVGVVAYFMSLVSYDLSCEISFRHHAFLYYYERHRGAGGPKIFLP